MTGRLRLDLIVTLFYNTTQLIEGEHFPAQCQNSSRMMDNLKLRPPASGYVRFLMSPNRPTNIFHLFNVGTDCLIQASVIATHFH